MTGFYKNIFIKFPLFFLFLLAVIFGLNLLFSNFISITKADSSDNISGWAWSETIGWISFNSVNCDSDDNGITDTGNYAQCPVGETVGDYGVDIDISAGPNSGNLSGYAWSENVGWISFYEDDAGNPPSSDPCGIGCIAKAVPPGQIGLSDVDVKGWARALSASDGWDGWLRFDHGGTGEVYISADKKFHGWAWGGDTIGWVSFNSDEGGGADYRVEFNCDCDAWVNQSCDGSTATIDCASDEMLQTRTCNPSGCNSEEQCIVSSICTHKECNEDDECVDMPGTGADLCDNDGDCGDRPWWDWRWWEENPK